MHKLLQIDTCLGVLSTGRITEGIGKIAGARGWECHIAHGARYVGKSRMSSYQVSTRLGEYLHYAQSLLFDRHGLGSVCATERLIRKIEEIRPDVIHLHCIHGYYLNYNVLFEYLNRTPVPVVWTFHDCWAFTGHCAHFVTRQCDKWKTGCYDCPLKSTYPKSLSDFSSRNYELKKQLFSQNGNLHLVPVSDWISSVLDASFLKDAPKTVIHNGVDVATFSPKEGKSGRFTIIGVASSWGQDKGLADFCKLRDLLPEHEYDIMLVGLSAEQKNRLPDGLHGVIRTDSADELARLYSRASVLVNPTYADTFPTVNLEALACGTPVITYDTGGSPEAVDEKTGVVVPQGDVYALAKVVRSMKEQPLSSIACRKRVEMRFNQDDCYARYIDLYEKLIKV